jgi:hypothetical protein
VRIDVLISQGFRQELQHPHADGRDQQATPTPPSPSRNSGKLGA